MKIFSWVHRRFHQKGVADEDAKKAENDKVELLENEALASACDDWTDGLLAIGTLGFDLSKTSTNNDQLLLFGHEDDKEDQEGEMEHPLLLKASSKHGGFHHVQKQADPSPCVKVAKLPDHNGKEDVGAKDSSDLDIECSDKKIRKSGERTTLADLLWGDSEKNLLKDKLLCGRFNFPLHSSNGSESIRSPLISKKKKIDRDESTHPIKKTKRLMRKILKKKIHPDISSQKKETAGIIYQEIHVHAT